MSAIWRPSNGTPGLKSQAPGAVIDTCFPLLKLQMPKVRGEAVNHKCGKGLQGWYPCKLEGTSWSCWSCDTTAYVHACIHTHTQYKSLHCQSLACQKIFACRPFTLRHVASQRHPNPRHRQPLLLGLSANVIVKTERFLWLHQITGRHSLRELLGRAAVTLRHGWLFFFFMLIHALARCSPERRDVI